MGPGLSTQTPRPQRLRCKCGNVTLAFRKPALFGLECGCWDCRQAREFEATRGGPHTASPFSRLYYYFENDVLPPHQDQWSELELTQLRENCRSTRLVTTCCRSTLAVDHPGYLGNVVMVPVDCCELDGGPELELPTARIYMQDWPFDTEGPPPPTAGWPTFGAESTEEEKELYRAKFKINVDMSRVGMSLQDLFAALGETRILGLPEGRRYHPSSDSPLSGPVALGPGPRPRRMPQ